MHDPSIPVNVLSKARKANLTRFSAPIEQDGILIRTALYDWDQICKDNEQKKAVLDSEAICEQLVMRSMPYDPYQQGIGIELATMGTLWNDGIKAMSNFYDKDEKLFKLWVKMNLVSKTPFILQYMVPFEILFEILKTYKQLEKFIDILKTVHSKHAMLYK